MSDIVLYPDHILRTVAREVEDVHSTDVQDVISQLEKTMESFSHCVGLAANQVGSDLNIFVADASKSKSPSIYGHVVVINAVITEKSEGVVQREGCMSVPDLTGNVMRSEFITVEALDRAGEKQRFELNGFEARVFQHEIDHLAGKVFLDRVRSARDVFARKSYRE